MVALRMECVDLSRFQSDGKIVGKMSHSAWSAWI